MIVHVEELNRLLDEIRKINKVSFEEIVWMKDGKVVEIPKDVSEEFRFTGLSNKDFIWFFEEASKD